MVQGSDIARYTVSDGIAILLIDSPPVNALSLDVRKALDDGVRRAAADANASALVICCGGRTFFAGADISEIGGPLRLPGLDQIFAAIEASPKPVIAAIHGTALGGGFELALACHYRVALKSAMVGLPEVSLGLLPGAGGTQRTPRIAGVATALELIVGGRPITAEDGQRKGMIDQVMDNDLVEGAITFAKDLVARAAPLRRIRDLKPDLDADRAAHVIDEYRKANLPAFVGFKAPGYIVQAIEAAVSLPFEAGLKREWELFLELKDSTESAAQRHLFFAERAATKILGAGADARPTNIRTIGIVGSGTAAGGIARTLLARGLTVRLFDPAGKTGADDRDHRNVHAETLADAVGAADFVIESVDRDLTLKRSVLREIGSAARSDAILASVAGPFDLATIAAGFAHPQRFIGLHLVMRGVSIRLVEVARTSESSPEAAATAMALGRKLGKLAIVTRAGTGSVAGRARARVLAAMQDLVMDGVALSQSDRALCSFGFPFKAFEQHDSVSDTSAASISDETCSDDDVIQRLLYPAVNEAAKMLEDGAAQRASDIDAALVAAYGWPAWTGGPTFWADGVGLSGVVTALDRTCGASAVSPLLRRLANDGGRLSRATTGELA